MAFVGPLRAFLRPASSTGVDHEGRQRARASAASRGRLARAPAAEGRLRARPPPTWPRLGRRRARLALPAAAPPTLTADVRPRQTAAEDRRRLRELAGFVWAIATEQPLRST